MAKKYLDDTGLGHFWDKTAYKYGIEYIVGTQSASTNAWTGVTLDKNCASSTIPTGKVIVYHLPYAGTSSAATLNLTLPDGTTSGAKNVYRLTGSTIGTNFGAGCDLFLVFNGTEWKVSAYQDTDSNNYDRMRHYTAVKAASAVTAGQIIVGTDAGYKPVANGVTFSINYPILYAGSAIAAAATGNNNYDAYPGVNLQTTKSGYTGTTYKMTFLVGTLSGTTFTVNSDIFTQTIPSSADGKVYAPIGLMTDSTKTVFFFPTNNYWEYRNGAFRPISTCPTLATVATSGSYNDLSNKPTIPTVNNATLTIQKNGTTVKTFTANASSNVTANITVPTKTSDITNDSGFITSSGTAAKAGQLTNARTIAISGGATGTATSFNGTSNISIPVTGMYETYLNWGNQQLSGKVSPVDAALSEEFSANRLAYMDASKITVEYSRDGGSTWTDYGLTAAQKVGLVTTSQGISTGGTSSNAASNYQVRVTLSPTKPYMATRKMFICISTNGVSGAQVKIQRRAMGGSDYVDVTTATISGWGGWNSIPLSLTFGGTSSWSNDSLRLTFSYTGKSESYPNAQLSISKIRLYGETAWSAPSNLATNGHLYTYDTSQNATFPADVSVTGSLKHGSYTYTLPNKTGTVAMTSDLPTVNNGTLTITQNGTSKGTFTANQSSAATIALTDTTYSDATTSASGLMSASDKTKLNGIATGAEVNQNAFSNVKVGSTTVAADAKTDTLELVAGSNVTLTPDATNDKVTIAATVPTVNNGTLTIQKNGSNVATFTANQSGNSTANITVPTKTSDITNDSNFTTTATAQKFAIGQGSTNPVFDDMVALQTIEWDVSDTTYRPIYQMANTGWTQMNMDITVAYRVTVTGTNINSVTDVVDRWHSPTTYPISSFMCRTLSTSAATTGLKYLRAVYPTSSYLNNATYPLGVEVEMHNSTARHVKVEVFKTHSSVTWNATKPSGSIYVSSTYNGNRNIEIYATRGWCFHQPAQMYANSAGQASYMADFEAVNTAAGEIKSGATALVAGHYAYLADDGLVYDISDTTHNIAMGESKIGFMNSAVNASTAISWTYWRAISRPSATQVGYFNHDTFALGNRVFLRCTMDSNGNIHSGNYLATSMTAGYTWMPFGWARSSSQIYVDTRFPMFYTLDSSGKLSHINGKAVAGTTYTAGAHINITGTTIKAVDYVHSESPVSTSSVTPIITNGMISDGTITFSKTATGEFLKLQTTTTDPGAGSALAANTLLGVYEA